MQNTLELRPQAKQQKFLSSTADICIYGGAAGGGKSWALLMEPIRHIRKRDFGAVVFRRERAQITNEQAIWDESTKIYPGLGAKPNLTNLRWSFPSGARISFAGLQYETDLINWQGSQIALIAFDELTHFTERQFFYLLSRNRSMSGVKPYIRATTNPDADSWVAEFLGWWIDQDTGLVIPERTHRVRYLYRENEKNHWANHKSELAKKFPHIVKEFGDQFFKSVSFIPADIFDNKILLETDPGYLANLLALPLVDRERLLGANWKIKPSAGKVFNRSWFEIVKQVDKGGIDVRFWDLAATEKKLKGDDPDFTATVKIRFFPAKNINDVDRWYIIDAFQVQASPAMVEKLLFQTAELDKEQARRDGSRYILRWELEPGSASRRESYRLVSQLGSKLKGVDAGGTFSNIDKISRAKNFSAQAENGNVYMLRAEWNNELLTHLHGQPDLPHDDLMDAGSGAFNESYNSEVSGSF